MTEKKEETKTTTEPNPAKTETNPMTMKKDDDDILLNQSMIPVSVEIKNNKLSEIVGRVKTSDPEAYDAFKSLINKGFENLAAQEEIKNKKFEEDMVPIQEALTSCNVKPEDIDKMKKDKTLKYGEGNIMNSMKILASNLNEKKRRLDELINEDSKRKKMDTVHNNIKPPVQQPNQQQAQENNERMKRILEMQTSIESHKKACFH
ncbi:MAG: hypothetical protein AAB262_01165 [Elusimicrobiota bacterium]